MASVLGGLFSQLCRRSPSFKRFLWKQWYQYLAYAFPRRDWGFMNYGYAPLETDAPELRLGPEDEDDRYCIQLYHHVATGIDLKGLDVLEVGSGRGGGASYIARYLGPRSLVGVDLSSNVIDLCNAMYHVPTLSFKQGNAEALPLQSESVDAVINVESSHCYPSFPRFVAQVARVLRSGGHFLHTDFRTRDRIGELDASMKGSGLEVVNRNDITANVVRALDLDNERKVVRIRKFAGALLLRPFLDFAGTIGSPVYNEFKSRECIYVSYVLRKQG